ncbi:hypothetical protein EDD11_002471 [Mortierella claussenii]|nr:hypothetical protein EDD11_002471 [Mortierella claussenii]
MATLQIQDDHGRVFSVVSPILSDSGPNSTTQTELNTKQVDNHCWAITLTRVKDILRVYVKRKDPYASVLVQELSMQLIPHAWHGKRNATWVTSSAWNYVIEGEISTNHVLLDGNYSFDIAVSLKKFPLQKAISADTVHKERPHMLQMLKDRRSVDVCFVFASEEKEEACRDVVLWAHRHILAQCRVLWEELWGNADTNFFPQSMELLESNVKDESSAPCEAMGSSATDPFVIWVPSQIRLPTLCVLLKYIYTGILDFSVNFSEYAISIRDKSSEQRDLPTQRGTPVQWLQADTLPEPQNICLLDVMTAAVKYDMTDLPDWCEEQVIDMLSVSNVMKIYFELSKSFRHIRKAALDFIAGNMDVLFRSGEDPLHAFRNHPECHDFLVDLVRRQSSWIR